MRSENTPVLGELVGLGEQRDAVHVAIAPVIAVGTIRPGEPVAFCQEGDITRVRSARLSDLGITCRTKRLSRRVETGLKAGSTSFNETPRLLGTLWGTRKHRRSTGVTLRS